VIEVGLPPAAQAPFGVNILDGRSYSANSPREVMLGYALAKSPNKTVGQTIVVDKKTYSIVGFDRTNVAFRKQHADVSFLERRREFGIYRSIGWNRWRVIRLVIFESLLVSLVGAAVGLLLGWVAINALQHLHQLRGVFVPTYRIGVFVRSLLFAVVVAFLGALYPALRAAFVAPLKAMRNE
jgi:hypothetical protein